MLTHIEQPFDTLFLIVSNKFIVVFTFSTADIRECKFENVVQASSNPCYRTQILWKLEMIDPV